MAKLIDTEILVNYCSKMNYADGSARYYKNDKRIGTSNLDFYNWYYSDKLHREDGPAWETPKGKGNRFYLFGVRYSEKEYNSMMAMKAFW